MKTLWQDLKYGLRMLMRSPCFTVVAVLSLSLGIGANTAIFSMINGILYKALPVRNPHELRVINWTCDTTYKRPKIRERTTRNLVRVNRSNRHYCGSFPYPVYRDFAEQAQGFSDIFAFSYIEEPQTINAGGVPTLARARMVSGNFFKGYGAPVLIGRPIAPEDDRPDTPPVAVLTFPFWQRLYGLDPHVIGRTLMVRNTGFTIIGVLPRHYVGPLIGQTRADFYVPMMAQPLMEEQEWLSSYNVWRVQMMGRLAPGTDEAKAETSLQLLFSHVVSRSEAVFDQPGILLQKGRRGVWGERGEAAEPLWNLMGVVGLVLLIACTNLAGLLLARGAARQHEMAVRAAMGAGRWRLIRQSLTESMILSLAGVCLGLVLSLWIRTTVTAFIVDPSSNRDFNLKIDTNVLLFALAAGMVTALLSGLFPALRAGNTDPSAGLKDSGTRGAPRLRLGKVLVSTQVGLSVILVVAGGLLCRTLINLYRTDTGFNTENLLSVPIRSSQSLSPPEAVKPFFNAVRQKIAEIPGVRSVALAERALLSGSAHTERVSIPARPDERPRDALEHVVSDGYFATMGINLLQGRDFRATDTLESHRVAIVNEEFARSFFPEENPLGQFIQIDDDQYQIVGICRDHRCRHLRRDTVPIYYSYHMQLRRFDMTCMVRSVLPPMSLVPAVRKAVADVDRNMPLEGITTQKLILKKALARQRLFACLSGSLALLALALSCIGLYGIMAYNVARRTGEMGIRKALGAQPVDVAWPILREALTLAAIGIAIGLPVALALVRLIESNVYGIEPHDPLTMIGTVVIMVTVAALAAWFPARRAARIDPMEALRYE
ncbi:MAG: ABC transporter permease [Planctomycetota bacterium]|jgi:predicted permease